jgi:hypothetical protein
MKRTILLAAVGACLLAVVPTLFAQGTPKPLASAPTNWEGVTIDLMSVERKGSVLTVKWAVRNTGAKPARIQFGLTGRDQNTYVLDEESGVKYYVLTDKEKNSLASSHGYLGADTYGIDDNVEAGATSRYWMKFPAPPPAVKTINVFFSKTEPFEGVAIIDK